MFYPIRLYCQVATVLIFDGSFKLCELSMIFTVISQWSGFDSESDRSIAANEINLKFATIQRRNELREFVYCYIITGTRKTFTLPGPILNFSLHRNTQIPGRHFVSSNVYFNSLETSIQSPPPQRRQHHQIDFIL